MADKRNILYCNCSYKNLVPGQRKREIRSLLNAMDAGLTAIPDLCELAARRDPELETWAATERLIIVACFPRAVRWLFAWTGFPLRDDALIINARTESPEAIRQQLDAPAAGPDLEQDLDPTGNWVPWFPVLDYQRCTNCKQCLSFCPFGVYSESEAGIVTVTQPENCKNNCPACARVCPSVAIMFPKLADRPINGDEVTPGDLVKAKELREKQKAELAKKGIHSVLAKRKLQALMRREARGTAGKDDA